MGNRFQLGRTVPLKVDLFYKGQAITSQNQLNQILIAAGDAPACPEILVYATNNPNAPLPDVDPGAVRPDNPGYCFGAAGDGWHFNLGLDSSFVSNTQYEVQIQIGDCLITPTNNFFTTK